ncbi:MAG: GTP-binding protein [Chloroflexi bacterium]|nr:GTP-binding protein [Chloroflexota bacterium]
MKLRLALAGNPNVGKSSLFNQLTGSQQHVGNWPGKTVEFYQGHFEYEGTSFDLIDLPGTYSLNAFSEEEVITRDYLLEQRPDLVINVVDANQLERNLYLTVQLLELGLPCIMALNKMDVIENAKIQIDVENLSHRLGIPIVPIIAENGTDIPDLLRAVSTSIQPVPA